MDISQFSNQMKGTMDYGRTNLFQVTIPATIVNPYNSSEYDGQEELRFMAKAASLPGKSLGTIDVKRFGAIYKIANDAIVDTFSMTVMCSGDMRERRYFDAWISGIHGQDKNATNADLYRMKYYDDYTSVVIIESFGRDGSTEYTAVLQEAYPTSLGAVDLSWDTGDIATFTVNFTYRNWFEVPTVDEGLKFGSGDDSRARQE
tara:strand:+ start:830 stop:1438 length:609 start_codon:yes stop_codon:yes gene_type:complete